MRLAPLAAGLLLALAGCGSEGEERVASAPATTDLSVRVTGAAGDPGPFSLRCGEGGGCDPRRLERLAAALEDDARRACTELYGGPERAHVTGLLEGRDVDSVITRSDGCGIADYDALFEALGRPAPLAP